MNTVNDKLKFKIIQAYSALINHIMAEISTAERNIIECPNLGTVLNGSKRFFADECKKMLIEIISDYYSVDNIDKIKEYQSVLHSRLNNEYNYENMSLSDRRTEQISKIWATKLVIRDLNYMEKEYHIIEKEIKEK